MFDVETAYMPSAPVKYPTTLLCTRTTAVRLHLAMFEPRLIPQFGAVFDHFGIVGAGVAEGCAFAAVTGNDTHIPDIRSRLQ